MATVFNELQATQRTSVGDLMRLTPVTARPTSVPEGTIIYRTGATPSSRKFEYYNGIYWQALEEDVQAYGFTTSSAPTGAWTRQTVTPLTVGGLNNAVTTGNFSLIDIAGSAAGPISVAAGNLGGSLFQERVTSGTQAYKWVVDVVFYNGSGAANTLTDVRFGYCQVNASGVAVGGTEVWPVVFPSLTLSLTASRSNPITVDFEVPALAAPTVGNSYAPCIYYDNATTLAEVRFTTPSPALAYPFRLTVN